MIYLLLVCAFGAGLLAGYALCQIRGTQWLRYGRRR